jgi:hypothetical protein
MADSDQNQILWGFLSYARNNPYSHLDSVHWDEIDAMAKLWCTSNYTDSNDTLTTTDPGVYGAAQDIPGPGALADGAGISGTTASVALYDQAHYPQRHYGG